MTVRFELPATFVASEDIPLSSTDLRCGLEKRLIKPSTAAALASREVSLGSDDPVLHQLALLLQDETDQAESMLLDESSGSLSDWEESLRKWLYLELKAAYLERANLDDPLGVVEEIYADFDYPTSVIPFVRYMPLPPGDRAGVDVLMERWKEYLEREHTALARD